MGTHLFGKREDPWWSGTMNAFTVPLFGNSHAGLNFRVPLCEETHDTTQPCRSCKRTMQQAARRATRYFTRAGTSGKTKKSKKHYLHFALLGETKRPRRLPHYRKVAGPVCLATSSSDVRFVPSQKSSAASRFWLR